MAYHFKNLETMAESRASDLVDVPLIVLTALLLRWLVSLHGYSGEGTPPNFGDFEVGRVLMLK
jgi:alpha-1,3-glucosyltransferase